MRTRTFEKVRVRVDELHLFSQNARGVFIHSLARNQELVFVNCCFPFWIEFSVNKSWISNFFSNFWFAFSNLVLLSSTKITRCQLWLESLELAFSNLKELCSKFLRKTRFAVKAHNQETNPSGKNYWSTRTRRRRIRCPSCFMIFLVMLSLWELLFESLTQTFTYFFESELLTHLAAQYLTMEFRTDETREEDILRIMWVRDIVSSSCLTDCR